MRFIYVGTGRDFLEGECLVFMMFTFLREEGEVVIVDLTIVCEFPDVFPNDISDLIA